MVVFQWALDLALGGGETRNVDVNKMGYVPPALRSTLDSKANVDLTTQLDLERAVLEGRGDLEEILGVA